MAISTPEVFGTKEELFRTLHESSFQFLCKFQERASEIIIIFLESEITTELLTCLAHSLRTLMKKN